MEKLETIRTNRGCAKYYRLDRQADPREFLEDLTAMGWTFDRVFLRRDAELDMQSDMGFYAPADLPSPDGTPRLYTLTAHRNGKSGEIHFSDDSNVVYLVTKDEELELN